MILLVMGVTGSGKTTVGKLLASRLGWTFLDADDFHSASNVEKMTRGIPLTDADREPWLRSIHEELIRLDAQGHSAVLACSALKQKYHDLLKAELDLRVIYIKGSYEVLYSRIASRQGHFAHENLLASQFAALEEPAAAITVDASQSPEQIAGELLKQLKIA